MTVSPTIGWRTSSFGPRTPPRKPDGTYGTAFHRGVDIGGPAGSRVVAPQAGTVVYIGRSSTRGLYVIVQHDARWRTLHQHLDSVTVYQGQQVAEGQQIGVMGTSGGVARHLHTEVHDQGTPIDPEPWYAARGVKLGTASTVLSDSVTAPDPDPEEDDDMPRAYYRIPGTALVWEDLGTARRVVSRPRYDAIGQPPLVDLSLSDAFWRLPVVGTRGDCYRRPGQSAAWQLDVVDGALVRRWVQRPEYDRQGQPTMVDLDRGHAIWRLPVDGPVPPEGA